MSDDSSSCSQPTQRNTLLGRRRPCASRAARNTDGAEHSSQLIKGPCGLRTSLHAAARTRRDSAFPVAAMQTITEIVPGTATVLQTLLGAKKSKKRRKRKNNFVSKGGSEYSICHRLVKGKYTTLRAVFR